jgi:class I fructose-bisphosphate aldolase
VYDRDYTHREMLAAVVRSAGRSAVLLSGGARADDRQTLLRAKEALDAGVTGLIFGRNVWERERADALSFVATLRALLAESEHPAGTADDQEAFQ